MPALDFGGAIDFNWRCPKGGFSVKREKTSTRAGYAPSLSAFRKLLQRSAQPLLFDGNQRF